MEVLVIISYCALALILTIGAHVFAFRMRKKLEKAEKELENTNYLNKVLGQIHESDQRLIELLKSSDPE